MKIKLYDKPILDASFLNKYIKDDDVIDSIMDYMIHEYRIIEYESAFSFIGEVCEGKNPVIHGHVEYTGVEYTEGFDPQEIMEEIELYLQKEYPGVPILFPSPRPISLVKMLDIKAIWYKKFPDLFGFTKDHEVRKRALEILRNNEIYWEWDSETPRAQAEALEALFSGDGTYYFYDRNGKIVLSKFKENELLEYMDDAIERAES